MSSTDYVSISYLIYINCWNRYRIFCIVHQIFAYSNKWNFQLAIITIPFTHPSLVNLLHGGTYWPMPDEWSSYQKWQKTFPWHNIHVYYIHYCCSENVKSWHKERTSFVYCFLSQLSAVSKINSSFTSWDSKAICWYFWWWCHLNLFFFVWKHFLYVLF